MKEIEFVCYNSAFENATPLKNQQKLCRMLLSKKDKYGILPYRQNFSIGRQKQIAMAVIVNDTYSMDKAESFIRKQADKFGIEIDMEREIDDSWFRRVKNNQLDGQTGCD